MHHHHQHNSTSTPSITSSQPPTQRRRKKRPNYGTRTVEVRRGYSGFGFTISGQQPCRLSCIIPNSPADQAGLRAGDCLISVNGLNVSKLPHETVVQLIGNSFGSIRMQIAEHYYSDSTDEENTATCSPSIPSLGPYRPRYVYHKTKQQRVRNSPMKKNESILPLPRTAHQSKKGPVLTVKKASASQISLKRPLSEELKCTAITPSPPVATSPTSTVANVRAMVRAPLTSAALEYKAVVGYLGTIEMPKQISHSSKLQTVRSCIRKLRQEKRTPSTVLMIILPDCLKLISNTGNVMATYASSRLNYVSSSSESENRFFGLVTSTVYTAQPEENDDEEDVAAVSHSSSIDHITISNSCHVFVVDTKLCDHSQHSAKAQEFRVECTKDPISSSCLEFPNNSEYVVNLIRSMYTMRIIPPATQRSMSDDPNFHTGGRHNATAHSPQPSNHSEISTTTSNSDSGIGYNNDCSNITDRIVVVDFPQPGPSTPRSHAVLNVSQRPHNIFQQDIQENMDSSIAANKRLTVRAMPDPKIPYNLNSPARCLITSRSCDDVLNLLEQESEKYDNDQQALNSLPQQCYASMDDISLYPQPPLKEDEHEFVRPQKKSDKARETQSLTTEENAVFLNQANAKEEKRKTLKLQFDAWNSLEDLSCQSAEILQSSPDKLASTPDLSKVDMDSGNSPFERGWIQTSLRTPRADKHTLQFSLTPETTKINLENYHSPPVGRSGSLTNSDADRNSLKYGTSLNDLNKPLPKGPTAWGTAIEILLGDPAGIKSFAEFLKLEYAAENIFFWTACERFKNIENPAERQAEALIIYTKHLTNGSLEPVNVDSRARSLVEKNLCEANRDLFQPAQKQIFNLMKFDCYQRFLKSDLYKQCLQAEKKGKPLPYTGENLEELLKTTNFSESASLKLKKSASNAEEGRRRRSLLPWHRKANHARSKSRDRIANEKSKHDNVLPNGAAPSSKMQLVLSDNLWKQSSSIYGSKSSLASFDATLPVSELSSNFCRIRFPDGATSITQLRPSETVAELVERLFEKRNLKYQFYDVSITGPPYKAVELQSLAQDLSRKEIEIEQRVAFKLDLPTPKVISVKSKPKKQLYEVVRPILQRYNINPEVVEVVMRDTQEKVDLTQLVTHVDNQRLQVVLKKMYPPLPQTVHNKKFPLPKNSIINGLQATQSTLDEITNKVFSDLMDMKNQDAVMKPAKCDQGSLKSDDCASESSSFLKRLRSEKKNEDVTGRSQIKSKKAAPSATCAPTAESKLAVKEKIKTGLKEQFPSKVTEKQDDLLEDLKRAQLARLEDQRGTEINFELPEFLKSTETLNSSSSSSNNNNKTINEHPLATSAVERPPQPAPRLSIINPVKLKSCTSPMNLEEESNNEDVEDLNSSLKGPPPLPPKPKVLPIKPSNWGVNISQFTKTSPLSPPSVGPVAKLNNANVAALSSNNAVASSNARCAYLDQPSSSFV